MTVMIIITMITMITMMVMITMMIAGYLWQEKWDATVRHWLLQTTALPRLLDPFQATPDDGGG